MSFQKIHINLNLYIWKIQKPPKNSRSKGFILNTDSVTVYAMPALSKMCGSANGLGHHLSPPQKDSLMKVYSLLCIGQLCCMISTSYQRSCIIMVLKFQDLRMTQPYWSEVNLRIHTAKSTEHRSQMGQKGQSEYKTQERFAAFTKRMGKNKLKKSFFIWRRNHGTPKKVNSWTSRKTKE